MLRIQSIDCGPHFKKCGTWSGRISVHVRTCVHAGPACMCVHDTGTLGNKQIRVVQVVRAGNPGRQSFTAVLAIYLSASEVT